MRIRGQSRSVNCTFWPGTEEVGLRFRPKRLYFRGEPVDDPFKIKVLPSVSGMDPTQSVFETSLNDQDGPRRAILNLCQNDDYFLDFFFAGAATGAASGGAAIDAGIESTTM